MPWERTHGGCSRWPRRHHFPSAPGSVAVRGAVLPLGRQPRGSGEWGVGRPRPLQVRGRLCAGQGGKAPAPQPRQEGHPQPVLLDTFFLLQTAWPAVCTNPSVSEATAASAVANAVPVDHLPEPRPGNAALGTPLRATCARRPGRKRHSPSRPSCPSGRGCHLPPAQTQREGNESEPLGALGRKGQCQCHGGRELGSPSLALPVSKEGLPGLTEKRPALASHARPPVSAIPRRPPRASRPPPETSASLRSGEQVGREASAWALESGPNPSSVASDTVPGTWCLSFLIWKVGGEDQHYLVPASGRGSPDKPRVPVGAQLPRAMCVSTFRIIINTRPQVRSY